ncbi:dihydrofolate reductase [Desulfocicer vacuolatum DSM 3385]|uniref:Dihydrofolate reductase n=1 Tax=Desulfocicer vacuolatum DSM 3385 TaxID=1121400 RepID=A0A1W2CHB4_9BACT|nr:dihydrofolate reductase family protein [Desulfocicer vacuolatum]SMC84561.1 dihydrofolate reductase [Desulfocicer vacuolatum DSM 3385]
MKVILVMATTLDGKIGRHAADPVDWTGSADKKYFVQVTRRAGVMIMGNNTFNTIGRPLPGRKNIVMTRTLEGKKNKENLIFTNCSPEKILQELETQGRREVALIGGAQINSLFARQGLIHEVHLTIAPRLFGQGLSLFNESCDLNLKLISMDSLGRHTLLLKYDVA